MGAGLQTTVSSLQTVFYIVLVVLGILGNTTVIVVIGKSVMMDRSVPHNSNIIIINMAVSNLMVSVMRNILLVMSDLGIQLFLSKERCQFLMGVWVWLRSVNVWSTFYLSVFHLQTLRRVAPSVGNLQASRGVPKALLLNLLSIWLVNLLYSIPAHIFSTNGNANSTETLMLISSTTRPLLGCVWNFPSSYSGLAYATTSMVIHETLPIVLMTGTNLSSLYTLYTYGRTRSSVQDAPVVKRVPAERRAAKVRQRNGLTDINRSVAGLCKFPFLVFQVILILVLLFIVCWGTSVTSVNYFNYNRGTSSEFLLVIARFANIIFIALSPAVLAVGHRGLRSCIKSSLTY
ncbi:olfactory receptor class A-like protein 4 [Oryzias melastigma]|uniref:olfactory receptor class A-like protein 4 n=1 Tax=Oryzias melastigma TaxID=30732 RepID=UPI00168D4980|nr:olfactory receptor class A-like protein 4 [Oryzias melastigma]